MYCSNCGVEVNDNASVCIHCGCSLKKHGDKMSACSIVGFILSFFSIGICAFVLCCVGIKQANNYEKGGKGLAVAGIVITILHWIIYLFAIVALYFIWQYYLPQETVKLFLINFA